MREHAAGPRRGNRHAGSSDSTTCVLCPKTGANVDVEEHTWFHPHRIADGDCDCVTDFGVAGGVELGFDTPLDSTAEAVFFAKKIAPIDDDLVAAVGVSSIGFEGQTPNPYLILTAATCVGFGPEQRWCLMTGVIGDNTTGDNSVYVNIGCTFALDHR